MASGPTIQQNQLVRHRQHGLGRVHSLSGPNAVVQFNLAGQKSVAVSSLITHDPKSGLCSQCLRSKEACLADNEHQECCLVTYRGKTFVNFQRDCYANAHKAGKQIVRHGRPVKPTSRQEDQPGRA